MQLWSVVGSWIHVFYYRIFGIAAVRFTFNIVLLVAIMSILSPLLPGIAGIVLTVGMAVDANVLIFSRIQEELKRKRALEAIDAGYNRAFNYMTLM